MKRATIETTALGTDAAKSYVEMSLRVPRGLLQFLEVVHQLGGDSPKDHLEKNVLAKELECLMGNLPESIFDMKVVRERYGEGSDVSDW